MRWILEHAVKIVGSKESGPYLEWLLAPSTEKWCCIWSNVYKPWKFHEISCKTYPTIPKVPSIYSSIHPFIRSSDCILVVSEVCTYLGYQVHLCSYWFGPFLAVFFGGCCVGFRSRIWFWIRFTVYICIYVYVYIWIFGNKDLLIFWTRPIWANYNKLTGLDLTK